MDYEKVKIVVSPYTGRLFVMTDDGYLLPIYTADMREAYIYYRCDRDKEKSNGETAD